MSDFILSHKTPVKYASKMVVAWLMFTSIASVGVWLVMLNIWVAVCALILGGDLIRDIEALWLGAHMEAISAAYLGFWVGLLLSPLVFIAARNKFTNSRANQDRNGQR